MYLLNKVVFVSTQLNLVELHFALWGFTKLGFVLNIYLLYPPLVMSATCRWWILGSVFTTPQCLSWIYHQNKRAIIYNPHIKYTGPSGRQKRCLRTRFKRTQPSATAFSSDCVLCYSFLVLLNIIFCNIQVDFVYNLQLHRCI